MTIRTSEPRWRSTTGQVRAVAVPPLRVVCMLAIATGFSFAGEAPSTGGPRYGLGLTALAATGLGPMSGDLNHHPGFGLAVQAYVPAGSCLEVRPAFEWTGYRVNPYNLAARLLASALGASYEETRVVFRTYRLGCDGVVYFRERYRGPFLTGGVGVQLSQLYVEDVVRYEGESDVRGVDASSVTTGLWLGGGVGYQWEAGNVELRVSRAPYRYAVGRSADGGHMDATFEPQPGWALHLMFGVRSRPRGPSSAPTNGS